LPARPTVARLFGQGLDDVVALLGDQFHAVGGEQLIVADRGRESRAMPAATRSGPRHVMIAVAPVSNE